jgi:DNA polymerase III subunit delta'
VSDPGTVLGHEQALAGLAALYRGDGPHTLLLAGPEGIGRRPVARWLAAFLNCQDASPAARPCGRCSSCLALAASRHPDVREIGPLRITHAGRSRRRPEITIDQLVRRPQGDAEPLGPWLLVRPHHRRRVGIIDHAESLTAGAANAFLKMLEEPPAWAVVVLVATGPEALLPTVASRCVIVRLGAVDVSAFAELEPHPALRLGLPGPLLLARRQPPRFAAAKRAADDLMACLHGDLESALDAAERLAKSAEESASGADGDGVSPLTLLRERLRDLPPGRYAAALDALERCESALAAYANTGLAFTTLALELRGVVAG